MDRTLSALADPTRRGILAMLAGGEMTVGQIVAGFDLTQPTISSHLKVLERAGLITRGRRAQQRPCRVAPGALDDLGDWVARFRDRVEASYARLDAVLAEMQEDNA